MLPTGQRVALAAGARASLAAMTAGRDGSDGRRWERDGVEFGRIVGLSDGVFAIGLTLLVLGLDVPDLSVAPLAEQLRDRLPNLIGFALGFGLVANVWWAHHAFVGRLRAFDARLLRLNLVVLALVALAPFPTGLVGAAPLERAAVLPFIGLFLALIGMNLAMVVHAQRVGAWRVPLPARLYRWVLGSWVAAFAGMLLALLVALVVPVGGLVVATLSGALVEPLIARRAPRGYADWA